MQEKNYAYIDWQNLFLGIKSDYESWSINYKRFRIYLKDKYKVEKAYYFLGYSKDENKWMYDDLEKAGFIVVFKEQKLDSLSKKKWNIDSDLIFNIMKELIIKPENFNKIVLVSWDWDFKILVDFLIKQDKFKKILFPSKKFTSSLYKAINIWYKDYLINSKTKIEHKKRWAS